MLTNKVVSTVTAPAAIQAPAAKSRDVTVCGHRDDCSVEPSRESMAVTGEGYRLLSLSRTDSVPWLRPSTAVHD